MPGTNKRRFTVGGTMGEDVLDTLLALRDKEDNKLVAVVQRYPSDHPRRWLAVVEVNIPDNELMHACARCGRWETLLGPRFLRCGGCKSRQYCSKEVSRLSTLLFFGA